MIYIIRHGQTDWNIEHRTQGHTDIALNKNGIEQADLITQKIANLKIDNIISSDLKRAYMTAQIINKKFNKTIEEDKRLRECNYGEYDGQDKKLVVYEEHIENPFPNGESLKDVERRMYSFINYLKENFYDKKIGIVAHRAPQLALEVLTKKISWEEAIENDWRKTKAWQPGWKYII